MTAKKYIYTQKTMKYLRGLGFQCEKGNIVERYIPGKPHGKRIDFLGIIDIIACGNGHTVGVQSTGPSGKSSHVKTIMEHPNTRLWLESGNEMWLIWWRKILKKRGGKLKLWTPGVVMFQIVEGKMTQEVLKYGERERATEHEWFKWFVHNADFGPAEGDIKAYMKFNFMTETGKNLPEGYNYGSDGETIIDIEES